MSNLQYLSPADEVHIGGFLAHLAQRFFLLPNSPLYHYTTGENFINIMRSGELWATHTACLNDTTELVYAIDQLHRRVKTHMTGPHNSAADPIFTRLDEAFSNPGIETSPVFVACFSQRRDDLSQWRAYSGGEGGYAIQFDPQKLRKAGILPTSDGKSEPQILLARVEYDPANHAGMFDDILQWTERFFLGLDGIRAAPTVDDWANEFCRYWLDQLAIYAPCIKNPVFKDEEEWRLIYYLRPDDPTRMEFRQRQSMMSRHIPLRLKKPLPITEVLVGPCRHPRLSQIAAGDLLLAHGYGPSVVKVEITGVPYRTA